MFVLRLAFNKVIYVFLIAFLLLIPCLVRSDYGMHVFNMVGIYVILASSLNLLMGYTGQVSLGHAGFFGIGAYASALLMKDLGTPFWMAFPTSGIFTGIVGLLVCLPSSRLRTHYLLLVTFAFGEIFYIILRNWESVTGGTMGLTGIRPASFFSLQLNNGYRYYYLILLSCFLCIYTISKIIHSRIGRAAIAIRESENGARALGINPGYYKALAFFVSAFWAGIAGSLFTHLELFLGPETFVSEQSIYILLMVVTGGMGTLLGPVLGAFVLVNLPEWLNFIVNYRMIVYGCLIVLMIIFLPSGFAGLFEIAKRKFKPKALI
jgi:branched-chain amino acid transport system permease protein